MSKTILLINGPPRSGKDTLTKLFCNFFDMCHLKFADPLRKTVPAMFGLKQGFYDYLIEEEKDHPSVHLGGMSPREAQIWLSEEVMKPKFGQDIFGRVAVGTAKSAEQTMICVSDSGFEAEAYAMVEEFGKENVGIIRLRRAGCTFSGDSRGPVSIEGVKSIDLTNDGTPNELYSRAVQWFTHSFLRNKA